jgi:WD40 repeat protein
VDRLVSGEDVSFTPVRMWGAVSGRKQFALAGLTAGVLHAEFSPDGKKIVTVSDNTYNYVMLDADNEWRGGGAQTGRDAAVRIWNAQSGEELATLLGRDHSAQWATWSSHGRFLFTVGYDQAANRREYQIWDATTLKRLRKLAPNKGDPTIDWAVFDSNALRLLAFRHRGYQTQASLWDAVHGQMLVEFPDGINDAAFSPDGKWVVTAGNDWTVRLWDASTQKQIWSLGGHQGPVRTVAFSKDGRWLATGSDDATARIWRTANGSPYFTLTGHRGPVYSVAFSPDSKSVITGSGDGTARIWSVDPLPDAIARMPRHLAEAERTRFRVERPDPHVTPRQSKR